MLYFALIGILAGWLSGQIMKGKGHGLLGNLILGILGAMFGGWMLGALGFYKGPGLLPSLMTATIGSIALIYLGRLFSGRKS